MKQKESLYRQCAAALDRVIEKRPGGVFTEIDVETEAADPKRWKADDYQDALHEANAVCGTQYRNRNLARFGPIVLADGSEDFARIAGRIVYADAVSGPEVWDTPNGKIPRLMIEDDELGRQGRRAGTNRNDGQSWDEQPVAVRPKKIRRRKVSNGSPSKTDLLKRVSELQAEVARLQDLVAA